MTELLKQFQTRGLDIDRIAMTKARQDGKLIWTRPTTPSSPGDRTTHAILGSS